MITLDVINGEYRSAMEALAERYGSFSDIPNDEAFMASERLRAGYCVLSSPSTNITDTFRHYSIDRRVWGFFIDCAPEDVLVKKQKRTDKYEAIVEWSQEHLFEQVTPQDVMSVGEISYPTALKFISDRPDIFRRVKRGLYEIRDPKADRKNAG